MPQVRCAGAIHLPAGHHVKKGGSCLEERARRCRSTKKGRNLGKLHQQNLSLVCSCSKQPHSFPRCPLAESAGCLPCDREPFSPPPKPNLCLNPSAWKATWPFPVAVSVFFLSCLCSRAPAAGVSAGLIVNAPGWKPPRLCRAEISAGSSAPAFNHRSRCPARKRSIAADEGSFIHIPWSAPRSSSERCRADIYTNNQMPFPLKRS